MDQDLSSRSAHPTSLPPLIVDAHQDLAWNMLTFGRDYTRPVQETRRREAGSQTPERNGDTLLGWPEYQRGRVAVIFATLFAAPARRKLGDWDINCYRDYVQASRLYRTQVDAYHRLADEHPGRFRLVLDQADLQAVLSEWEQDGPAEDLEEQPDPQRSRSLDRSRDDDTDRREGFSGSPGGHPVGLVLLMEGAEGVREPAELEEWWAMGVRIIGPAWAGTRFCGGTGEPGPLTSEGFALLEAMVDFGFALDLSHMDEKAALQALDAYPDQVIASHANALALLKGADTNRHLTDRVLRGLIERDGVIGIVPNNPFLLPGWKRGDRREVVTLEQVVAQLDFICQVAGDARHAGLGSDFDGGFGLQSVPTGIDTIADLRKLAPRLAERGYGVSDIAAILGENWLRMLRRILPENR
jgi:membrane dipeptidase